MEIARWLPDTLRKVLSALWWAQRHTWKLAYFIPFPAGKSAWSYTNASWCAVSCNNSSWIVAWFIISVIFNVLPRLSLNLVTASHSGTVVPSLGQWGYVSLPFSSSSPCHTCRPTAADRKMVDQSLFPAHPNWRRLGRQLGFTFDPTFYWKHC